MNGMCAGTTKQSQLDGQPASRLHHIGCAIVAYVRSSSTAARRRPCPSAMSSPWAPCRRVPSSATWRRYVCSGAPAAVCEGGPVSGLNTLLEKWRTASVCSEGTRARSTCFLLGGASSPCAPPPGIRPGTCRRPATAERWHVPRVTTPLSWRRTPMLASPASSCPRAPRRCAPVLVGWWDCLRRGRYAAGTQSAVVRLQSACLALGWRCAAAQTQQHWQQHSSGTAAARERGAQPQRSAQIATRRQRWRQPQQQQLCVHQALASAAVLNAHAAQGAVPLRSARGQGMPTHGAAPAQSMGAPLAPDNLAAVLCRPLWLQPFHLRMGMGKRPELAGGSCCSIAQHASVHHCMQQQPQRAKRVSGHTAVAASPHVPATRAVHAPTGSSDCVRASMRRPGWARGTAGAHS